MSHLLDRGGQFLAGILTCGLTIMITLAMLPFSMCYGAMLKIGDNIPAWAYGLIALNILVPIGGTWLAIFFFRAPKNNPGHKTK